MDIISSEENIGLAYRNIKANKGSRTAGVDGKTILDMKNWNQARLIASIKQSLEWYISNKVRRVEIPKGNGKMRPLGIPTIKDRLVQQCILQVLEPICEAKFFERSNGFRPNRSTEHAIAQAMAMIQQRNLYYVIDIDIKGFFDNVSHGKLLKQMWTMGIRDKKLLSIISAMLKSEVAGIGFPEKGTPQGGIISPLLSNIVLNELDWWVASQWEEMPTRHEYKCNIHENGSRNKNPIYLALRKTTLKECYIVRYADDFKIFCRKRADAVKLFEATRQWLKERLGLDISPEKSKIVNLKRHYSEFLGFRLKAKPKGKKPDGTAKYVVTSHISGKASSKIFQKANQLIQKIARRTDRDTTYRNIGRYNAFVLGVHNYYCIATEASKDFHKISFHVNRTLKAKLQTRLKQPDFRKLKGKAVIERYGKSRELRAIYDMALAPIAYVQHRNPKWKRKGVNKYTAQGRESIHKNLKINMDILLSLMRNPVPNRSIEYNDNRISLYSGQMGKCAVTGWKLQKDEIHCHHKVPKSLGGDDSYSNLRIVHADIHRLIHAKNTEVIRNLLESLKLNEYQINLVNSLRKLCQQEPIAKN